MDSRLVITDLRTAPERTWMIVDRRSRTRVQIQIAAEPVTPLGPHAVARAMTVFMSVLTGVHFDDVRIDLVDQPLGVPSAQMQTQYRLRIGDDPVVALITLIAAFDEALDGDAPDWRAHPCSKAEALEFGGALQLHLAYHGS